MNVGSYVVLVIDLAVLPNIPVAFHRRVQRELNNRVTVLLMPQGSTNIGVPGFAPEDQQFGKNHGLFES